MGKEYIYKLGGRYADPTARNGINAALNWERKEARRRKREESGSIQQEKRISSIPEIQDTSLFEEPVHYNSIDGAIPDITEGRVEFAYYSEFKGVSLTPGVPHPSNGIRSISAGKDTIILQRIGERDEKESAQTGTTPEKKPALDSITTAQQRVSEIQQELEKINRYRKMGTAQPGSKQKKKALIEELHRAEQHMAIVKREMRASSKSMAPMIMHPGEEVSFMPGNIPETIDQGSS